MERIRSSSRRIVVALTAMCLVLTGIIGTASPASAANDVNRPTIFVHGYQAFPWGYDCAGTSRNLRSEMARTSLRTNFYAVGIYSNDYGCDGNLHGSAALHNVQYEDDTPWKAVAKAMSWYVYDTWTSRNIKVDLIGHSMGALIVRGAVYGAQIGEPGFSPPIDVGNAVSLGAPFGGSGPAGWCPNISTQCRSMAAGSADLVWLNRSCDAQGKYSTLWTVFGSSVDEFASSGSTTQMCTWPDRKFVLDNVGHGDYPQLSWVIQLIIESVGGQSSRLYAGGFPNKCLDVKYMATAPGTPVQTFDCNNTYAQFWTRERTGWPTQITALGRCLDRAYNGTASGTTVWLWPCNGSPAQQWIQNPLDRTIRSAGMCLSATGNWANFAPMVIYPCNGGGGELWS